MDWWGWSYGRALTVNDSHVGYQFRCTITDDHGYSLTSEPITLRAKFEAQEIEEGTYEGIYDGSEPLYFSFTPEETDVYCFYSESETKLWVKLFDENGICVLWDQYGVTSYIKKADKVIGGKPALKQLLCDMLDYGASTQQFFNYYTF